MASHRIAIVLAAAALVAGCGGGLWIGIGDDDVFDLPAVSLAAGASTVAPGATLRLAAAASDGDGIDSVAFYRLDGADAVLLGSDGAAPYEWNLVVPADGRTELRLFARATDRRGDRGDSAVLVVPVLP